MPTKKSKKKSVTSWAGAILGGVLALQGLGIQFGHVKTANGSVSIPTLVAALAAGVLGVKAKDAEKEPAQ